MKSTPHKRVTRAAVRAAIRRETGHADVGLFQDVDCWHFFSIVSSPLDKFPSTTVPVRRLNDLTLEGWVDAYKALAAAR